MGRRCALAALRRGAYHGYNSHKGAWGKLRAHHRPRLQGRWAPGKLGYRCHRVSSSVKAYRSVYDFAGKGSQKFANLKARLTEIAGCVEGAWAFRASYSGMG